jgi:hypothetical protein
MEQQSERKRVALRRAQLAASEARRQAAEARRLREEAAYAQQFQPTPGDEPQSEVPVPPDEPAEEAASPPVPDGTASDLEAVRQEMKERQET